MLELSDVKIGFRYTRPQLAQKWGYAKHNAIARGVFTPVGQKTVILFVTRFKQKSLEQYNDYLSEDRLHWEGEKGHGSDARIVNAADRGDEIHLFYREIHHSPFEYRGRIILEKFEIKEDMPSWFVFRLEHNLSSDDDLATHGSELEGLGRTEAESIISARRGQGRFREGVLAVWHSCAVTGLSRPDLLRASHIKPWRASSNRERLDPFNGVALIPQYDHLFDRGLVSFCETGSILISPAIDVQVLGLLGVSPDARLRFVDESHQEYLEFHRSEVFVAQGDLKEVD